MEYFMKYSSLQISLKAFKKKKFEILLVLLINIETTVMRHHDFYGCQILQKNITKSKN